MKGFYQPGHLLFASGDPTRAPLAVYGMPFDGTTSYRPGTRSGPLAIREASTSLEFYSPKQGRELDPERVADLGDLEFPFGNPEAVLGRIDDAVTGLAKQGRFPLGLGGEHLVTLGAIRALARVHPDLSIVQLDAHTDLRDAYEGEKLSHATVIRRCQDLLGPGRIYQFGIRSGTREEFEAAAFLSSDLSRLEEAIHRIGNGPAYLTVDIDVFDPAYAPGTGTPEPGGISFRELEAALPHLTGPRWIGADIVEVSPGWDPTGRTPVLAAKLLRELIIVFQKGA